MPDLPIMLKLHGRRAVIVGGGPVARRRAEALAHAGADVRVIAPDVVDGVERPGVSIERRAYREGDLDGALLVVIATDNGLVNNAVADEAKRRGVLVNRADDPEAGDLVVPAHRHVGPVTVAVSTAGVSARAGARIRDAMIDAMDPAWTTLLETVAPFRAELQSKIDDAGTRQAALRRLTDDDAMNALKSGGVEALQSHCRKIVAEEAV